MPRDCLTFRARDLRAAIKAAQAAGISVARYEVTKDGTIRIIPGEPVPENTHPDIDPDVQQIEEAIRNAKL